RFHKAITSLPITSSSSLTERVVITEVTIPDAVCTSISDSTSPSTISLMVPLNWLRTLMALIVMVFSLRRTSELLRPTQLRRQRCNSFGFRRRARQRQHAVKHFRFQRSQAMRATGARARQVDEQVQADFAVLDQDHAVGNRYGFADIVGHQQHGKTV